MGVKLVGAIQIDAMEKRGAPMELSVLVCELLQTGCPSGTISPSGAQLFVAIEFIAL
jgi:hypothetical protein